MRPGLVSALLLFASASAAGQGRDQAQVEGAGLVSGGFAPGYGFWVGDQRGVATLRTSLQPRYACELDLDGDAPCRPNGFVLRRARVRLGALIPDPSIELALQADLADLDQPLEEAWAIFRPWREARIAAGRMRIPFTREGLYAEERLASAELSPLTVRLQPPRDLGLAVGARVGPVDVSMGAWNGTPEAFSNDNVDLLYAARLELDLVGSAVGPVGQAASDDRLHVGIGAGALYDLPRGQDDGAGAPANERVAAGVADVALRLGGAGLDLSAGWRETDRGALEEPEDVAREIGASAALAYFVEPLRLVPAARFSVLRDEPAEGEATDSWELTAGVSARAGAADLLGFLLEYSLDSEETHSALAELRLVL